MITADKMLETENTVLLLSPSYWLDLARGVDVYDAYVLGFFFRYYKLFQTKVNYYMKQTCYLFLFEKD